MNTLKTTLWTAVGLFALAAIIAVPATADQVILDDLIVDGSACIGLDCVNGESFGFETIRIKENNLRIRAFDTSSTASFPSADWQFTFNDSSNGGQNKFSIDDLDASRTPFTIEHTAPSHSLYVDDGGRIGFGTSTPVADLHVKSGNTPTLRLEQDGSSGFTAQTWDVAGNEANFFIRDATNGSTLPIRLRPGAPTSAIDISATDGGNVGLGTSSPDEALHLRRAGAGDNVGIALENGEGTFRWVKATAGAGQLRVTHDGTVGSTSGNDNIVRFLADGNMQVMNDLTVDGTIFGTVSSSRAVKTDIVPVDTREVLAKVAQLPMTEWNYNIGTKADEERHLGPMAEDFYGAFGLGRNSASISLVDYSGVALAAIQGLNQELTVKDQRIAELESRLARLEAALGLTE